MGDLLVFPLAEAAAVDYLTAALSARGESATVGVNLPGGWSTASPVHVAPASDGIPGYTYPVSASALVRVTVWAASTTAAQRLAALCLALLMAHPGDQNVDSVSDPIGPTPARDPDNGAPIATFTVQVHLRPTVA